MNNPTIFPRTKDPPNIPSAVHTCSSITNPTTEFRPRVYIALTMWTIPQDAAGEIGKEFIAVKVYPIPK